MKIRKQYQPGLWNRREFLTVAGASMAALASPSWLAGFGIARAQGMGLLKFTEQLPIPPLLDRTGGGSVDLAMTAGLHQFHSELPATPTWGYGGAAYLGPTIEVRRGIPITVNATNALGAHPLAFAIDTTLHGAVEADRTSPRGRRASRGW